MSRFIKAGIGFDTLPVGPVSQNWPWFNHSAGNAGTIANGEGVYGGHALKYNVAASLAIGQTYQFASNATIIRATNTPENLSIWGFSFWLRIDDIPPTTTGVPLLGITHSNNPSATAIIPIAGIRNTVASGLELIFPSTTANITTSPYTMSIEIGSWYWVSVRYAFAGDSKLSASYSINNVELQSNIPVTFSANHLGTNVANRLAFISSNAVKWSIDDIVIQTTDGTDPEWPAGGGGTATPITPAPSNLELITPRRIRTVQLGSNGSINEWQSSTSSLENYQAAQSSTEFVESLTSGQTDLYKLDLTGINVSDCIGLVYQYGTNRYLNVETVIRDNATAPIELPELDTSGLRRHVAIQETTNAGGKLTTAALQSMEFGQRSR